VLAKQPIKLDAVNILLCQVLNEKDTIVKKRKYKKSVG